MEKEGRVVAPRELTLDPAMYRDDVASSRRPGNRDRTREHTELEDVRRFACDRCRSQKLRCERDRLSLNTPLRSTPCRRCIKAQVRCTTNDQAPIGRGPGDSAYTSFRQQRRNTLTNKAARPSAGSPRLVSYGPSDDDEDEDETSTQPEIRLSPPRSPQISQRPSTYVNDMEGVIQAASIPAANGNSSSNASILGHFHESRMQLPETSGEKSAARHKVANGTNRGAPFPRPARPESVQSTTAQLNQQNQNQNQKQNQNQNQNQHIFVPAAQHVSSPIPDASFDGFEEFDMIMDNNFDGSRWVQWPKTSVMDMPPESDSSHQTTLYGGNNLDDGQETRGMAPETAGPPSNLHDPLSVPSKAVVDDERRHQQWTRRLSKLVHTLMEDSCDPHQIPEGGGDGNRSSGNAAPERSELLDRGQSPMSSLFWTIEQFLSILGEISDRSQAGPHDAIAAGELSVQVAPAADVVGELTVAQSLSDVEEASSTTRLSTLMAIFSAYSGILHAYERIFKRIHRSLVNQNQPRTPSNNLMALLPLLQLDSVMIAPGPTQTLSSLQIHIIMDVSLQMLNQAGASLSSILDAQVCSADETRSCLIALLQSLTFKEGGDTVSTSQAIRDNINEVRNLFVARATSTLYTGKELGLNN